MNIIYNIWIFHRCLHYLKVVIFWECRFLITAVLCGLRQFYAFMSSSDNRGPPLITRKFDKQIQISRKFFIFFNPTPEFQVRQTFLCLNTQFSDLTWKLFLRNYKFKSQKRLIWVLLMSIKIWWLSKFLR